MMAVVQVDRDLVPAKRRSGHRQVVSEADDRRLTIFSEECWGWKLTVEAPNVGRREVRVERVQAGLGRHVVRIMGRRELGPARMRRSISFTSSEIGELS